MPRDWSADLASGVGWSRDTEVSKAAGRREGAVAADRARELEGEVEGAAGERVSGERKGPEPGGSKEKDGATLESEQEKLALPGRGGRRREGGRVGGGGSAGAGAGRGEYNSAAARRRGSFGCLGLQPAPSGARDRLGRTAEPAEERVSRARRAELRGAAGERNFAPLFPAPARHCPGGSRRPGSVRARRASAPAGWEDDDDVPEQQAGVQHAARRQPARGA